MPSCHRNYSLHTYESNRAIWYDWNSTFVEFLHVTCTDFPVNPKEPGGGHICPPPLQKLHFLRYFRSSYAFQTSWLKKIFPNFEVDHLTTRLPANGQKIFISENAQKRSSPWIFEGVSMCHSFVFGGIWLKIGMQD